MCLLGWWQVHFVAGETQKRRCTEAPVYVKEAQETEIDSEIHATKTRPKVPGKPNGAVHFRATAYVHYSGAGVRSLSPQPVAGQIG
ncbi:hypothetical protein V5799_030785 [Amblyomma americanum]|uniref:Uncharacterized protein n=1 Tax=Amblyomma americanum TaxID=6943 RepID=A0AAQ4EMD2_AMBAM